MWLGHRLLSLGDFIIVHPFVQDTELSDIIHSEGILGYGWHTCAEVYKKN